jgi:hypothetical protein
MKRVIGMGRVFEGLSLVVLLVGNVRCRGFQKGPSALTPLECNITRSECAAEMLGDTIQCVPGQFESKTFTATTCVAPTVQTPSDMIQACSDAFCNRANANPLVKYDYPTCTVNSAAAADPVTEPAVGTCQTVGAGSGRALVNYRQRWRSCVLGEGGVCNPLTEQIAFSPTTPPSCWDLTIAGAVSQVMPKSDNHERSVEINLVLPNAPQCASQAASRAAFALTPSSIGQATGGGTTVPLSTSRGTAVMSRPCATCNFSQLDSLRVNVNNVTIAGTALTNVLVATATNIPLQAPDASGRNTINAHDLKLTITGLQNGAPAIYLADNATPWLIGPAGTGFRLQGTVDVVDADANGQQLPVSVSINAPGAPASSQATACSNLSPRDRLFGFEDPQSWSSPNPSLSLVTSPVTQGCGGLGVAGQNFIQITGAPFTTSGLTVKPGLSVDLFIPNNQPNPSFIGNLQVLLSCPSGGVNNQFIGQVALTGKPLNQFSTLRFALPSQTINTLQRALNDCFFSWGLNVNQTNRTWIMDNLRFTP